MSKVRSRSSAIRHVGAAVRQNFVFSLAPEAPGNIAILRVVSSLGIRDHPVGQKMIPTLVRKKSAIKIAMEIATTVRVVLLPTPAVPPVVVIPK